MKEHQMSTVQDLQQAVNQAQRRIEELSQKINQGDQEAVSQMSEAKFSLRDAQRDLEVAQMREDNQRRLMAQEQTITQLTTTVNTLKKRSEDVAGGKWKEEATRLIQVADEDPSTAVKGVLSLLDKAVTETAEQVNQKSAKYAEQAIVEARQFYLDSLKREHSELIKAGYFPMAEARATVLLEQGNLGWKQAVDQAVSEAGQHYRQVKESAAAGVAPPDQPPTSGATSVATVSTGPVAPAQETIQTANQHLKQRFDTRLKKVL